MTGFAAGAATDIGQVRTVNQDNTLVGDDVFAVADGMGGHRGGEVASAVAVAALRTNFTTRTPMALVEAVREANTAVVDKAQTDPELKGMGTTLCALAAVRRDDGQEVLTIVNVGDSRAYLLKIGDDHLVQISEDHSLVQQLVRQGQLTADAAASHPQRNILTRALGIDAEVKPDAFVVLPVKGDRYVLCSDGLFNEVDETRIAEVLRNTSDPDEAARILVDLANEGGGRDNISVVVVDIIDDSGHDDSLIDQSDEHRVVDIVRYGDAPLPASAMPAPPAGTGVADVVTAGPDAAARTAGGAGARGGPMAPAITSGGPSDGVIVDRPLIEPARSSPRGTPVEVIRDDEPTTRFTWRVALFLVAFVGIFVGAFFAINWVADNSYFVGVDGQQVTIFRGKPGGMLWRQPEVVDRVPDLSIDGVLNHFQADVRAGREQDSVAEAYDYIDRIRRPISTTTTTTTTVPTTLDPAGGLPTTTAPLGP